MMGIEILTIKQTFGPGFQATPSFIWNTNNTF